MLHKSIETENDLLKIMDFACKISHVGLIFSNSLICYSIYRYKLAHVGWGE